MFKRLFGGLMLLFGAALLAWVGYNLFINRLPETQGRSPWPALVFAALLLFVGFKWVSGKSAD